MEKISPPALPSPLASRFMQLTAKTKAVFLEGEREALVQITFNDANEVNNENEYYYR